MAQIKRCEIALKEKYILLATITFILDRHGKLFILEKAFLSHYGIKEKKAEGLA